MSYCWLLFAVVVVLVIIMSCCWLLFAVVFGQHHVLFLPQHRVMFQSFATSCWVPMNINNQSTFPFMYCSSRCLWRHLLPVLGWFAFLLLWFGSVWFTTFVTNPLWYLRLSQRLSNGLLSWKVHTVTRSPVMEGEQGHKVSCHGRCTDKVTRAPVMEGPQGLLSWKMHKVKDSCHGW